VVRVRVREQQVELARAQLALDRRPLLGDLLLQVGVVFGELLQLDQVGGAALEAVPGRDELAVLRRLTRPLAGAAWVIPRAGLCQLGV